MEKRKRKKESSDKIKVMLATEGTYPFHHGGVSTWCDTIIKNLSGEFDFTVYSVIMNPYVTQKFGLPVNTNLIKVPLWGTEEPVEHLEVPFSRVLISKTRTTNAIIEQRFIPLFLKFVEEIMAKKKNPEQFGKILYEMYEYFQVYEYKKSFKSKKTWKAFCDYVYEYAKDKSHGIDEPGVYSLIQSLGWLYRFMTVLNTPIPEVDVCHSAAAAFCGIPCVLAKIKSNTTNLLTEHGVYMREQYLSLSRNGSTQFLSDFLIRLIHSVVRLNYFYADQLSPVCDYNTRWEKRLGVPVEKIRTIYNGADNKVFYPKAKPVGSKDPTVVAVARIDPVKDTKSFIQAADLVRKELPETKFKVFGSVTVDTYFEECKELVKELGLEGTFSFEGHTENPASAYHEADVIVLSSISEGFPYSVVEAMMSGTAIVSTEVGGVAEAVGEYAKLVPPRNPEKLAEGILFLLKDGETRQEIAEGARERALGNFTMSKIQENYYKNYVNLVLTHSYKKRYNIASKWEAQNIDYEQTQLYMEKALVLFSSGYLEEGRAQLQEAFRRNNNPVAIPSLLAMMAEAYRKRGRKDEMLCELEKAEAIMGLQINGECI